MRYQSVHIKKVIPGSIVNVRYLSVHFCKKCGTWSVHFGEKCGICQFIDKNIRGFRGESPNKMHESGVTARMRILQLPGDCSRSFLRDTQNQSLRDKLEQAYEFM